MCVRGFVQHKHPPPILFPRPFINSLFIYFGDGRGSGGCCCARTPSDAAMRLSNGCRRESFDRPPLPLSLSGPSIYTSSLPAPPPSLLVLERGPSRDFFMVPSAGGKAGVVRLECCKGVYAGRSAPRLPRNACVDLWSL